MRFCIEIVVSPWDPHPVFGLNIRRKSQEEKEATDHDCGSPTASLGFRSKMQPEPPTDLPYHLGQWSRYGPFIYIYICIYI